MGLYHYGKTRALQRPPDDGVFILVVQLRGISRIYNDSVGNEWFFRTWVNGTELPLWVNGTRPTPLRGNRSTEIKVRSVDVVRLAAMAEESDKIPDIGGNILDVDVDNIDWERASTFPIEVTVVENRGRYAGNAAQWRFNFGVKRRVRLGEVLAGIFK